MGGPNKHRYNYNPKHELMADFEAIVNASPKTVNELSDEAGVYRNAIRRWRQEEVDPRMYLFDSVLRLLGFKLTIVPLDWEDARVNVRLSVPPPLGKADRVP